MKAPIYLSMSFDLSDISGDADNEAEDEQGDTPGPKKSTDPLQMPVGPSYAASSISREDHVRSSVTSNSLVSISPQSPLKVAASSDTI